MADETAQAGQAQEAAEQEAAEKQVDWEAKYRAAIEHSREWERKAKANKGAADELEKLEAAQMTDLERVQKEAEDAKAKLAELEAARERAELVAKVAESTDVPSDLFSADLGTEDGMKAFAKSLKDWAKRPSAPSVERPGSFDAGASASGGAAADFSRFMNENVRK